MFQILNVYVTKYESGGQFWPIAHNTTIFSLVLSQIIALGVFGIKESSVASGFTIPLIICTLLFNEYCRQRFLPTFKNNAAEVSILDELSLSFSLTHKHTFFKIDRWVFYRFLLRWIGKMSSVGEWKRLIDA